MNQSTATTSSAVPDMRSERTSFFSPLAALFGLTLRQHLHGRRIWVMAALFLLPAVLAVILRSLERPAPTDALEFALVFNLIAHALAPLTALLFASGMVQDEVEEQTLTYLLLRPVQRATLYLTKYLATLVTTTLLITVGTVLLYTTIYWGTSELWGTILPGRALKTAAIFSLGQAAYCALFGAFMLLTRRSLIAGVAYIVGVEGVLANLQFVIREFTVVYYTRVLALRWLELPEQILSDWRDNWGLDLELAPTATTSVLRLGGAALVIVVISVWRFNRMEFSMKTPEGS